MNDIRSFLFWLSTPIQKLMQKLHPPYAQTTVKQAQEAMKVMKDGDILLSREAWHFTNIFIPGFWSHAAIFGQGEVVESVAPYVQKIAWEDWVIEKHNWCVLRCEGDGEIAFRRSLEFLGGFYDYQFGASKKGDLFYCSGLVYRVWKKELFEFFGKKKTFTPEDFYQLALAAKLKVIHEHRDK